AAVVGGVLVVVGTDADDTIVVSQDDTNIYVDDNGVMNAFARSTVNSLDIAGGAGNDTLQVLDDTGTFFAPIHSDGGAGDDMIDGGAGNDVLEGGDGADFVFGYGGNDDLVGGDGANSMDGGDDADRYVDPNVLDSMVMDGTDTIFVTPPP